MPDRTIRAGRYPRLVASQTRGLHTSIRPTMPPGYEASGFEIAGAAQHEKEVSRR
jgi:hypothetical protein